MGTFHATQMVTFQRGKNQQACKEELKLVKEKSIQVPPDFHTLQHPPKVQILVQPKFSEQVEELWYAPDPNIVEESNIKDLSWIVLHIYDDEGQTVPAWTGFNQLTDGSINQEICNTGYLPLINAPAHEYDTLWTVMVLCLKISEKMNPGQSTVITFDQQLYCKATELQWANNELCGNIFIRIGGFHTAKTFMQTIGQHFTDSGLQEVWMESQVYGENTAHNNMQAKSFNRTIRAHKLTYEALWKILWPQFVKWASEFGLNSDGLEEEAKTVVESLKRLDETVEVSNALKSLEDILSNLLKLLDEFEKNPVTYFQILDNLPKDGVNLTSVHPS